MSSFHNLALWCSSTCKGRGKRRSRVLVLIYSSWLEGMWVLRLSCSWMEGGEQCRAGTIRVCRTIEGRKGSIVVGMVWQAMW